ncbi:MAG: SCE4755 family polysaccharide monooxygenase-like protein [Myxococcota bacterium]
MSWFVLVSVASAHILMDEPRPRTQALKIGPCGDAANLRSANVATFAPGETITIEWHETIDHPSHFRIAFDEDGTDDFVDPATPEEYYNTPAVLLDQIPDDPSGTYSATVTLPAVTCSNCTLQLVQLMYDKPPYTPGTDDLYYQCADLELVAPETGGTGATGSTADTSTGGSDADADTDADSDTDTDTDVDADTGEKAEAGCGCDGAGRFGGVSALVVGMVVVRQRRRSTR